MPDADPPRHKREERGMSHPDCPLCPENGKVEIIHQTEDWFLVFPLYEGGVVNDAMLAIPRDHHVELDDLPPWWGAMITELRHEAGKFIRVDQFSVNLTRPSRTLDHFHAWFIQQDAPIDPCKGFYGVLRDLRAAKLNEQHLASVGTTH